MVAGTPRIAALNPSSGAQGQTVQVTITGQFTNFQQKAQPSTSVRVPRDVRVRDERDERDGNVAIGTIATQAAGQ